MKTGLLRCVAFSLSLTAVCGAGTPFPDDSKPRFPLDAPAVLVASFGEYRPDHLHPGADFSTGGRTGLPVHAVEDGRIFRLKVEWRGYGRALYIRHSDGRISVYAHLERYEDRRLGLEKRVSEEKRTRGLRYPGDIYLDPPVPVRKGDVVAFSGESGAGLPHLHYEMRREDQEPSDPLVPGWIRGAAPPVFGSFTLQADSAESWIDGNRTLQIALSRRPDGVYVSSRVPAVRGPFIPEARIFSQDREGHRLGIAALTVKVDGVTTYRLRLGRFRFAQYPEVGLLLDHARSRISPPEYTYLLTRLKGNDLGGAPADELPWPSLPPGEHTLEVEAGGALGEVSRALLTFRELPPVRIDWEGALSAGTPQTVRFGAPRSELGPGLRVSWSSPGSTAPVLCPVLKELPDGEVCGLSVTSEQARAGVTAGLLQGAELLGRVTRFLPRDPGDRPVLPRILVEPWPRFVDLRLMQEEGRIAPARIVVDTGSGEHRFELVQQRPEELLASIPSDLWGDGSAVRLEWETPAGPRDVAAPVSAHAASVESGLRLEECGVRLLIEAHSMYEDTPLQCDAPAASPPPVENLILLGSPVRLLPGGVPLSRKGTLTFPLPADSHPERIGVYRLDSAGKRWMFEGGEREGGGIRISIGRLDTFSLIRDDSPPRILGVEPSGRKSVGSARPLFRVPVEEHGSGLNYDGVHLLLDGQELETEYDPDRGWSTATPSEPLSPGTHAGTAWAVDRAGNRSNALAFELRVR